MDDFIIPGKLKVPRLSKAEKARREIYDVYRETLKKFDGSEYQQGKKDGLRIALAILGDTDLIDFVRGGNLGREKGYANKKNV